MQVFGMHKSVYKLNSYVSTEENSLSPCIENIREQLKIWQKLKSHSIPDLEISQITRMSRSSFYRYKKSYQYL
jgi:ACT domain-containing protein